ncbi:MAG: hypothetical protein ACO1OT_02370 [Heyndrickxia sp.]
MAEALVSFGAIFFVATILFPLMFQMIIKLETEKENLLLYRILYESTEEFMINNMEDTTKEINGDIYKLDLMNIKGKWKACVSYENRQKCIAEMEK